MMRRATSRARARAPHRPAGAGALAPRPQLLGALLLLDDDLRESAAQLEGIDAYLGDLLELLEREDVEAAELRAIVETGGSDRRLAAVDERLEEALRRMGQLAESLD